MTLLVPDWPEDRRVDGLAAARALFASLADAPREMAAFAYLDPEWRLLGMRHTPLGATDAVDVPVRAVAGDALALDAAMVVMAHNHPSGDATPSEADLALTRRLGRALDALDVRLIDHLILARGQCTSLYALGLV